MTPVNIQLIIGIGECSPFYGKANVKFTLGSQTLSHELLFADIKNDVILGIDFLSANRCDVLLSKDHLTLNGEKTACYRSTNEAQPGCCRIALLENDEVPPGSEMILKGRPIDKLDKNSVGILEASESSINLNESQKESMQTLLSQYKDQFSSSSYNFGSTSLEQHTIRLKPDCKPIKQRPYRIPLAKHEVVEREVKLMAEKQLIEPSYSAWCSPAVLVPKRDGSTRFCIYYRRLN